MKTTSRYSIRRGYNPAYSYLVYDGSELLAAWYTLAEAQGQIARLEEWDRSDAEVA